MSKHQFAALTGILVAIVYGILAVALALCGDRGLARFASVIATVLVFVVGAASA